MGSTKSSAPGVPMQQSGGVDLAFVSMCPEAHAPQGGLLSRYTVTDA